MSSDTVSDHDLKFGMLDDMLTCVDTEQHFNGTAVQLDTWLTPA
jgi:hypothetical protein